jgi:hypothetical protein
MAASLNDAHHIRFLDSVRTNRPASIAKTKRRVKLFIQTQARRRFVERVLGRGTVAMARLAGAPMLRFFTRPLASRRVGASFARRAAGTVRHRALNTRRGWDCHVSGLEGNAPIRPGHYRRWIGRSRPSSGLPPLMTSVPWCCCSPASTTPITARCYARCTPVPGATAVCRSSTRRDRRGARPPRRGPCARRALQPRVTGRACRRSSGRATCARRDCANAAGTSRVPASVATRTASRLAALVSADLYFIPGLTPLTGDAVPRDCPRKPGRPHCAD